MTELLLLIDLIFLGLATWRLSHLLSEEDGPGDVFHNLRIRLGAYETDDGWDAQTFFGKLLLCPLCLSIWFAIPLYALEQLFPVVRQGIYALAITGLASFMQLTISGKD